jgi:hypothetical protein
VARLLSLHDGDVGAMALMLAGPPIIPAVRAFLFKRDPSGIYQPRCWAVEVLAALHAYDVLRDYLSFPHDATDPVERAGDEAVVNAAARALSSLREEWVFQLLLSLARRQPSAGVIDALGSFDRPEAIPHLIDALAEDDCRTIAESALRRLRAKATPAIIQAATGEQPLPEYESETSLRQRRSALRLLTDAPLSQEHWRILRHLVDDQDTQIAVLACSLCPLNAQKSDRAAVVARLTDLLSGANWILAMDIERCLSAHRGESAVGEPEAPGIPAPPSACARLEAHKAHRPQPQSGEKHRDEGDRHTRLGMITEGEPDACDRRPLRHDQVAQATHEEKVAGER